jgi:hypothetical protein
MSENKSYVRSKKEGLNIYLVIMQGSEWLNQNATTSK